MAKTVKERRPMVARYFIFRRKKLYDSKEAKTLRKTMKNSGAPSNSYQHRIQILKQSYYNFFITSKHTSNFTITLKKCCYYDFFIIILRTSNITVTLKSVANDLSVCYIWPIVFASNTCLQNENLECFLHGQNVPSNFLKSSKTSCDVCFGILYSSASTCTKQNVTKLEPCNRIRSSKAYVMQKQCKEALYVPF